MTHIRTLILFGVATGMLGGAWSGEVSFGDAFADGGVTFAVFGDYGSGEPVAELVESAEPSFIVAAGDGNYGNPEVGSPDWDSQIGRLYGDYILGRAADDQTGDVQRFFPTVGNHDVGPNGGLNGSRAGYLDFFNDDPDGTDRLPSGQHTPEQSYYDIRHGNIHLFSLDSQAIVNAVGVEEQLTWLATTAVASDATWKFAFFHHPAYSSGPHGSHAGLQLPFAEMGFDAVFSGHDHVYERIELGTTYLTVGTGGVGLYPFRSEPVDGSQVRYNDQYGALFATVTDDMAKFQFVNVDGELIDQFELATPEPSSRILLLGSLFGCGAWFRTRMGPGGPAG